MAAHRRTNSSDVRLEVNQSDEEDGNAGGSSNETDEIDLENEQQGLLSHSLVPAESFRG